RRIVDDIGPERGEDADGLRVERLVRLLSGEGAQVDALAQVVEEREVVDPTGIEVEEHDLAQNRVEHLLRLLLDDLLGPVAELLAQLCHRFIVLADLGSPFEDELALFGHELVEPPGVTVQGGVLALGDALGVLDESAGAFGFDQPGLITFGDEALDLRNPGEQLVLEAGEEHRRARIALPTGAAAPRPAPAPRAAPLSSAARESSSALSTATSRPRSASLSASDSLSATEEVPMSTGRLRLWFSATSSTIARSFDSW